MKILAIDTAANLCAACVLDTGGVSGPTQAVRDIGKGHVEHLMDVMSEALAGAGCGYADLSRIAVSVGPGSFTGVRVGVSAARGLSLSLAIPAVGISTLDALAQEAVTSGPAKPVLVAIAAGRGEAYWAKYRRNGEPLSVPGIAPIAEIAASVAGCDMMLAGSAARLVQAAAGPGATMTIGRESATAEIGTYAQMGAAAIRAGEPRPLYLRQPDAKPQAGFAVEREGPR